MVNRKYTAEFGIANQIWNSSTKKKIANPFVKDAKLSSRFRQTASLTDNQLKSIGVPKTSTRELLKQAQKDGISLQRGNSSVPTKLQANRKNLRNRETLNKSKYTADRYSKNYSTSRASDAPEIPALYPNSRDLKINYTRDRQGRLVGQVA